MSRARPEGSPENQNLKSKSQNFKNRKIENREFSISHKEERKRKMGFRYDNFSARIRSLKKSLPLAELHCETLKRRDPFQLLHSLVCLQAFNRSSQVQPTGTLGFLA